MSRFRTRILTTSSTRTNNSNSKTRNRTDKSRNTNMWNLKRIGVTGLLIMTLLALSPLTLRLLRPAHAVGTAQTLPFTQDWSNASLITANDNWSGVPGIVGFRGDGLTGATGTNPQTIVAESTVVNVIASDEPQYPYNRRCCRVCDCKSNDHSVARFWDC
jgi:hypothetical protein